MGRSPSGGGRGLYGEGCTRGSEATSLLFGRILGSPGVDLGWDDYELRRRFRSGALCPWGIHKRGGGRGGSRLRASAGQRIGNRWGQFGSGEPGVASTKSTACL